MRETIEELVRAKYATAAESGLSTEIAGVRAVAEAFGYTADDLASIPAEANIGLSCGNPTALARLRSGEVVVDLGSGGGIDVLLAAAKVGPAGKAIGIDMTPEMVALAQRNAAQSGLTNTEFHLAPIDRIPLADASADCVISNCVINLASDKRAVFREVYRILRPGGRVAISDIALKQPLPVELAADLMAYVGCIAGAISIDDYRAGLVESGFANVQVIDTQADLNVYGQVDNQACCCSPSMGQSGPSSSAASSCGPAEGPHQDLGRLLQCYDVNHYAASVKIYALKPESDTFSTGRL